jgi:hypothetical protein
MNIKQEIKQAIEISDKKGYAKCLIVIEQLKEEWGNCSCIEPEWNWGLMTTPEYKCIKFGQCIKCNSYAFPLKQIYDWIEDIKSKTKIKLDCCGCKPIEVLETKQHNVNFYK